MDRFILLIVMHGIFFIGATSSPVVQVSNKNDMVTPSHLENDAFATLSTPQISNNEQKNVDTSEKSSINLRFAEDDNDFQHKLVKRQAFDYPQYSRRPVYRPLVFRPVVAIRRTGISRRRFHHHPRHALVGYLTDRDNFPTVA